MGNNVAVDQNFKGVRLLNYKIRQGQLPVITEHLSVDGSGKLAFWDQSANAGAGAVGVGVDTRDIATDLANILGGQTVAGAASAKNYIDNQLSTAVAVINGNITTVTDIAENAANDIVTETGARIAADANLQTQINNMSSMLTGGIIIRPEALDFTTDPLVQLAAANGTTAILKGHAFVVSVAGTFGGVGYDAGDLLVAKQDAPSLASLADFHVIEHNIEDATTVKSGVVKLSSNGDITSTGNVVISPAQVKAMIDASGAAQKALAVIPANTLVGAGATTGIVINHGIANDNCLYSFKGTTTGDRYTLGLKTEANGTVTVYSDVDVTEEIAVTIVG